MANLIDRAALLEWLKKAGRFMKCCEETKALRKMIGGIINHIEKLPAVDAVEVVRCKDCKYYEIHKPRVSENCERKEGYQIPMMPNDYCSYGERREDNA